jgi:hypothetical protein
MEWLYGAFIATFFVVEIVMYILGRRKDRNIFLDHIEEIIKLARRLSDELGKPSDPAQRLCGIVVGLAVLWMAAMFFVAVLTLIIVPFELKEWVGRLLFAVFAAVAGFALFVAFQKINHHLS